MTNEHKLMAKYVNRSDEVKWANNNKADDVYLIVQKLRAHRKRRV